MKKIITLFLIFIASIGFASCGSSESESQMSSPLDSETDTLITNYIDKILTEGSFTNPFWNTEKIDAIKAGTTNNYWNYIDGVLFTSLCSLYKETNDKKYIDFVKTYVDNFVDSSGTIATYKSDSTKLELDSIAESRVLFDLYSYTNDEKYKKAINYTFGRLAVHPRVSTSGSLWHKYTYTNQVWLDGAYMAFPFYTKYANMNNDSLSNEIKVNGNWVSYYDDIYNQYKTMQTKMKDSTTGLYYHGYDETKAIFWADSTTGCSKSFWLRSIGWLMASMVDVLEDYPAGDKYNELKEMFANLCQSLYAYIDTDSNMFYQIVDKTAVTVTDKNGVSKTNYLETSGSSLVAYAYLKGARLNLVDSSYQTKGFDIYKGICNKYLTNNNGSINLGGICKTAGLGGADKTWRDGSIEYYLTEEVVENDGKGFGPFIMAYTELIKL